MFKLYFVAEIPIKKLLHDNKMAYLNEGHGGKPFWHWPIYHFFKLYASGDEEDSKYLYINWYIDQYQKYSKTEKKFGGMQGGSLDRLYKKLRSNKGDSEFKRIVSLRVDQRFHLFESIKKEGYQANQKDPVYAFKLKKDAFLLQGGHHRVAVMAALGRKEIPNVYVFHNRLVYKSYRFLTRLKKYLQPNQKRVTTEQ